MLQRVIADEKSTVDDVLIKHTFKDAVLILNEIWKDLSQSVLESVWKKLMQLDDNQYDEEERRFNATVSGAWIRRMFVLSSFAWMIGA